MDATWHDQLLLLWLSCNDGRAKKSPFSLSLPQCFTTAAEMKPHPSHTYTRILGVILDSFFVSPLHVYHQPLRSVYSVSWVYWLRLLPYIPTAPNLSRYCYLTWTTALTTYLHLLPLFCFHSGSFAPLEKSLQSYLLCLNALSSYFPPHNYTYLITTG